MICFFIYRLERSKVRVKFFQSGKPQQISPPDNNLGFYDFEQSLLSDYLSSDINNISDSTMTATAVPPTYDRQIRWVKKTIKTMEINWTEAVAPCYLSSWCWDFRFDSMYCTSEQRQGTGQRYLIFISKLQHSGHV